MSLHNIIGREDAGPHVVIRQVRTARRRSFAEVVLSAVGGLTLMGTALTAMWVMFG